MFPEDEKKYLKKFENSHAGQDCFLVANGPSLNQLDLSLLEGYTVFGMNKIYLIKEKVNLKIDYHVAVNPYVIEQSYNEFVNMEVPSFLAKNGLRRIARTDIEELPDTVYPIDTGGTHFYFASNPYRVMNEGHTVTYVALQLIYWMGFRNVFIIGLDHYFNASGSPNELQKMNHADPNHFHPDYFKGKEWHLPDIEHSERAYFLALDYYHCNGRNIFDATVGGKARIFPKLDYENALLRCGKKGVQSNAEMEPENVFNRERACHRLLVAELNEKKLIDCLANFNQDKLIQEFRFSRSYRLGFYILHPWKIPVRIMQKILRSLKEIKGQAD